MKIGFYPRLAFHGMRKNSRLYIPYLLTCIGMIMMFYIILALSRSQAALQMRGGNFLSWILRLGSFVIAVFSLLFLFYTNSFLNKRRKKEFGLYNILGMGKGNVSRIVLWEAVLSGILSLILGLGAGILLFKLAELGLVNIMHGDITYQLGISPASVRDTILCYTVIFILIFVKNSFQVQISRPIELLKSEQAGEKAPKANWIFGTLGVLILGCGYALASVIKDPFSALLWFFAAVILVIIGTYLIMVAGSVMLCRILQKKKSYYYKTNHFISVSSMVYRMKRNGAGLASICILATMVLVMLSSTACLYFGEEDALNSRYPMDINATVVINEKEYLRKETVETLYDKMEEIAKRAVTEEKTYFMASVPGLLKDGVLEADVTAVSQFEIDTYANVWNVHFIDLEDYNRMTGKDETLKEREILLYAFRGSYKEESFAITGREPYRVKKILDQAFLENGDSAAEVIPALYVVVPDLYSAAEELFGIVNTSGKRLVQFTWNYGMNTDIGADQQIVLNQAMRETLRQMDIDGGYGIASSSCESREENREDFIGTFGGLFFLGIILSIVFIFAAVLIIYYKQISEGYEDQSRFEIMQKVGMTPKEIRRSINSQLLTVFFLPLLGAGLHLVFAFHMIRLLLTLFQMTNVGFFMLTTLISFVVFGVFYTLVYRITSNAYYKIVSCK